MKFRFFGRAAGVACASFFLWCGYDPLKPPSVPFSVYASADAVVAIHDTLRIRVSVAEPVVWGVRYVWYADSRPAIDTTTDSVLYAVFSAADTGMRRIVVKAVDGTGRESRERILSVNVVYHRPSVALHADTTAPLHALYRLRFSGTGGDSRVASYSWFIDDPGRAETTGDTLVAWIWGVADTGRRVIVGWAVNEDGISSRPCTLFVNVVCHPPTVLLRADTVSFTGEAFTVRFSGTEGGGRIERYVWFLDDSSAGSAIIDTVVTWVWQEGDTGRHVISAYAVDRDSLTSAPAFLHVTVLSGAPVVEAMHDTVISSSDTLMITCRASDPNGVIAGYVWDIAGFRDTTVDSTRALSYRGNRSERVTVGARDNDGLVSSVSFTVTFDRPPVSFAVYAPLPDDTVVFGEKDPGGTVAFSFSADEPDGDEIVYALRWRRDADSAWIPVYQGTERACQIENVDTGRYVWELEARDARHSVPAAGGGMTVLREHRICFVGHSYVIGLCGSDTTGGFRAGVLDSLRSVLGPYDRLRAVGPITSAAMCGRPEDDSSMAVSGIDGQILFNTVSGMPSLTADIWVIVSGLNDGYNPKGIQYLALLMDMLYERGPAGRIFVSNGNPVDPYYYLPYYWLPYFNQWLPDTVALRKAAGMNVTIVDAFTALGDSSGQYVPSLFYSDGLHPNQEGYDRLRDAILSAMKAADPPVLNLGP